MKQRLIILFVALLPLATMAQREKFQINGAARGYYFGNDLDISEDLDTITTRKANYGHTLLDLGVSVFPNENTEVIGMFRIRNELGGFWGGGVSFNVRQLTLRGVAGGIVKYELGDIDLSMTPYTLWNFREEGIVNEGDVFSMRRDIVHYDLFYNENNTWRMQGAQANFGLQFGKVLEEVNFKGFITRQRATDGAATPERLYGGGRIGIVQSKFLTLGFNTVNIFDLTETIQDSIQYKNSVHTFDFLHTYEMNQDWNIGLKGEAGMSDVSYLNFADENAPEEMNEWFYDIALMAHSKPNGLKFTLGYKDVGADFLSPGAQTRRVNFARFPGLYQQFTNAAIGRPTNYADVINGNAETSFKLSEQLLPYHAAYNNTNPYGTATPNRRGVYLEAERVDSTLFRHSFARVAYLSQSRGTGTVELKNFLLVEAGTDVFLNDLYDGDKTLKFEVGVRLENTIRGGADFESVDLSSTLIDAGISWEFAPQLDLLLGAKLWNVSGTAFINERDIYNSIVDFDIVQFDFVENTMAGGLRYRFNPKNTLSLHYQIYDLQHAEDAWVDYGISQFNILYSLSF